MMGRELRFRCSENLGTLDLLHRSDELIHVNRFGHIAVRMTIVSLKLMSFGGRTGHDYDRVAF